MFQERKTFKKKNKNVLTIQPEIFMIIHFSVRIILVMICEIFQKGLREKEYIYLSFSLSLYIYTYVFERRVHHFNIS